MTCSSLKRLFLIDPSHRLLPEPQSQPKSTPLYKSRSGVRNGEKTPGDPGGRRAIRLAVLAGSLQQRRKEPKQNPVGARSRAAEPAFARWSLPRRSPLYACHNSHCAPTAGQDEQESVLQWINVCAQSSRTMTRPLVCTRQWVSQFPLRPYTSRNFHCAPTALDISGRQRAPSCPKSALSAMATVLSSSGRGPVCVGDLCGNPSGCRAFSHETPRGDRGVPVNREPA